MIKELMHDPIFLAGKSEVATKEDLQVSQDLLETLTRAIDEIHTIFGKDSLVPAIILDEQKMPYGTCDDLVMSGWMYV